LREIVEIVEKRKICQEKFQFNKKFDFWLFFLNKKKKMEKKFFLKRY